MTTDYVINREKLIFNKFKFSEVPKIPPLKSGRPQSKSDRLSALISKANEIKGRSPNPPSDGESAPASPAGTFHFCFFIQCCKIIISAVF